MDDEYADVTARSNDDPRNPELRQIRLSFTITKLHIDRTAGARSWARVPFTKAGNEIIVYRGGASFPEDASLDA